MTYTLIAVSLDALLTASIYRFVIMRKSKKVWVKHNNLVNACSSSNSRSAPAHNQLLNLPFNLLGKSSESSGRVYRI